MMDEFWLHMAARYGHAWVSQYSAKPNGTAAAEWRATLSGLTREQVQHGFRADVLRGEAWPPSSPQFRALCLGIPTFGAVVHEIGSSAPRTGFAALVWSYVDVYAFARADARDADRMIRVAYDLAREDVMRGATVPQVPEQALASPKHVERKPADPETALRHLAEIDEILGSKPSDETAADEGPQP